MGVCVEVDLVTVWRVVSIVSLIVSLGSAVAVYMNSPGRKLDASVQRLTATVDEQKDKTLEALKAHDRRIQAVEDEIKHLPTSEEIAELQVSLAEAKGQIARVDEMVTWVKATVQSMDNYLRSRP